VDRFSKIVSVLARVARALADSTSGFNHGLRGFHWFRTETKESWPSARVGVAFSGFRSVLSA